MKIREILNQHRRDFQAIYVCEHCGKTEKTYGYDDANFHSKVVPNMECRYCHKKAPASYRPLAPLYAEGERV